MKALPHPTFATWFQRFFVRAWLVIALLFVSALLPFSRSVKFLGVTLALGFAASLLGTLAYLFYRLYHVPCPQCGQPMRTARRSTLYAALCFRCNIEWGLGLGVGSAD